MPASPTAGPECGRGGKEVGFILEAFPFPPTSFPPFQYFFSPVKADESCALRSPEKQLLGFPQLLLLTCPGLFLPGSAASGTMERRLDPEDAWLSPYWVGFPR